jgi:nucleoside-diphosphate-sugar epimerase
VKKRVLIAGCGYLGTAAADLFHSGGWTVEGWTHSEKSATELAGKPYKVRAVDISEGHTVRAAKSDFELVIHCASSGGGDAETYRRLYFDGARNLLTELQPARFLYVSSTSVYAQTDGEWVNEESPAEPVHATGRILRETEELVRQADGLVARLAGIYGPGRSALLREFLSGEARIEGAGQRYLNQAHRDDLAAALLQLSALPDESGIFNVTDNQPLTQRECYQWLANRLDRPLPPETDSPRARKRGASNKRVSNQKLRALGWEPAFPTFQIGMEQSVLPAAFSSIS